MNVGCTGKTVRTHMPYLGALEMCSRRGAIQIHVYLYLYRIQFYTAAHLEVLLLMLDE